MAIQFNCPSCGQGHTVAEAHAGKGMICKGCAARIVVPQAGAPAASGIKANAPMTRKPNFVFIAAALLMLLGMCLPWISWPDDIPADARAEVAGYDSGFGLPILFNRLVNETISEVERPQNAGRVSDEDLSKLRTASTTLKLLFFLYLIPLVAAVGLVDEVFALKRGKNHWWMRLLTTLSPGISFLIIIAAFVAIGMLFSDGTQSRTPEGESDFSAFSLIGVGVFVLAFATVLALISIFTSPKPKVDASEAAFKPRHTRKLPGAGTGKVRRPTSKVAMKPVSLPATSAHPPDTHAPSVRLPRKSGRLKPPTES